MKAIVLLMMLLPAVCSSEIYRWIDDKGRIHYSDDVRSSKTPKNTERVVINKPTSSDLAVKGLEEKKSPKAWIDRITDQNLLEIWSNTEDCNEIVSKYYPEKSESYVYARSHGIDSEILKGKSAMIRVSPNLFWVGKDKTLVKFRISANGNVRESKRADSTEWVKGYRCEKPYLDEVLINEVKAAKW